MRSSHLALHEQNLPPAAEWTPSVPGWLFLRVRLGEGYLWRQTAPRSLGAGDVVISARAAHCQLRASQLGELRVHYFWVLPEQLAGVLSSFERQHLEAISQKHPAAPQHYPATHVIARQFATLDGANDSGEALLARCQMLQLVGLLLREEAPAPTSRETHAVTARDRFEKIIMQMPEGDLQFQSPATLAKLCGCSVRHFSRLFKSYFGHSFIPKKTELKLHKARQLLVDTDGKIIDVAMDSGFQHVGLFTTLFKKQFGATPSQYRSNQRRKKLTL